MNKIILTALIAVLSTNIHAKIINSQNAAITPAEIDKIVRLVDKNDGSSQKKLQIIVTDQGMSTDVSPRFAVYLGYASLAEMGNMSSSFKINDQAMNFISAKRKTAGIYEIKVTEYREDGMYEVTQEINAEKMFIDEKKLRAECGDDFCHRDLKTSVKVKEIANKIE